MPMRVIPGIEGCDLGLCPQQNTDMYIRSNLPELVFMYKVDTRTEYIRHLIPL